MPCCDGSRAFSLSLVHVLVLLILVLILLIVLLILVVLLILILLILLVIHDCILQYFCTADIPQK